MYTHETLNEMTVPELRQIALSMNIAGMSKKRKDVVIDAILAKQGQSSSEVTANVEASADEEKAKKSKLTGVEFNAVSKITNPTGKYGDKAETWCRISSGATSQQFDVAGYTIADVMDFMKEVLNVEKTSDPIVNGEKAKYDYVIQAGDNIEFIKPAGRKG